MKYGHLERIRVPLTVLSPLFIGSGERLQAKEIILDEKRRLALIPSLPDMVEFIANHRKERMQKDFIDFMMDSGQKNLAHFLERYFVALNPPPPWVRYAVEIQPDVSNINTLLTFVRDPDGNAFIPGSSIKGALRTAMIASRMSAADGEQLCRELSDNPRDRRASAVENTLRTLSVNAKRPDNPVNDLMRAIEVSDSLPFPPDALTVCRRHWLSEDGREGAAKSPVFMECLRPESTTAFDLTIDHSLWPAGEDAPATLRAALNDWDARIRRAYESRFSACGLEDVRPASGAFAVLGGGTGFQRKSLVYHAKDRPEDAAKLAHEALKQQFRNTYKPPFGAQAAPYKLKAASYRRRLWPMGVCRLDL